MSSIEPTTVTSICIGEKLAPFNPTSLEVVAIALEMLQIGASDIVYDLGCGDARFLIEVPDLLLS